VLSVFINAWIKRETSTGHQIRLGIREPTPNKPDKDLALSGGPVVSRNDVIGKHSQGHQYRCVPENTEKSDANVTPQQRGEHAACSGPSWRITFSPVATAASARVWEPQDGHGFADNIFGDRTEGGFAIAATGESRASIPSTADRTCAISADHFTEQKGRPSPSCARIRRTDGHHSLCNRLGTLGNRIARKDRDAVR